MLWACRQCACSQVASVEAELGSEGVPARVTVPGTQRTVMVHRLMAFTGTRFVNAMALRSAAAAAANRRSTEAAGQKRRARRGRNADPANVLPAKRHRAVDDRGADQVTSAAAAAGAADVASLNIFLDIIAGDAPAQLSAAGMLALVDAATICMASAVLQQLPAYLAPFLRDAPYLEACASALCQPPRCNGS
jgi:hypothetical protein